MVIHMIMDIWYMHVLSIYEIYQDSSLRCGMVPHPCRSHLHNRGVTKLVSEPKFSYGLQSKLSFSGITFIIINPGITMGEISLKALQEVQTLFPFVSIFKSIGMSIDCCAYLKSHISRGIRCHSGFDLEIVQLGYPRSQKEPHPNLKFLLPRVCKIPRPGDTSFTAKHRCSNFFLLVVWGQQRLPLTLAQPGDLGKSTRNTLSNWSRKGSAS